MTGLTVVDWLTPETLVLSLTGALDGDACRQLFKRLAQLLEEWPGMAVTLDLSGIRLVSVSEAEELFLQLVARRTTGSQLALAKPSAACLPVLKHLNISYAPHLPGDNLLRKLVGGRV